MSGKPLYSINKDLFSIIDQSWKAYFLGWIYADGCMTKNLNSCRLALNSKDESVLRYFTQKIYPQGRPLLDMISHNEKLFLICNKKICSDLVKLGVVSAKSFILDFPTSDQVQNKFLPLFVRGYFEGDGSVTKHGRHGVRVSICLTKAFGSKLSEYLFGFGIISRLRKIRSIYTLDIWRYDSVCKFFRLVYSDVEVFRLDRKYQLLKDAYDNRLYTSCNNSGSKYTGIFYNPKMSEKLRWHTTMVIDKKKYDLGKFPSETEALNAKIEFLKTMNLEC